MRWCRAVGVPPENVPKRYSGRRSASEGLLEYRFGGLRRRPDRYRAQKTKLTRESEAMRVADNLKARVWHITNLTKQNRLGQDVGYALYPEGQPVLLADPSSSIAAPHSRPSTRG